MALTVITEKNKVSYQALSTDISGSKINGANWIGADVYIVDTQQWYRVKDDLILQPLVNSVVNVNSPIDFTSQALVTVDFAHHQIHAGESFVFTYTDGDLDVGENINLLLVTPNTTEWIHMIFVVSGIGQTNISFYEDVGFTGGSSLAAFNNNRNSLSGSTMNIFLDPTGGSGSGTLIFSEIGGSDSVGIVSGASSNTGERIEFILKQNTKYLFKVNSGTANNRVAVELVWYAHTSGTL